MLTILGIPKPFRGHINIIQRNAIKSWTLLRPKCEIILFNDEKNTTCRVASEFGLRCITNVKRNKFGLPLLDDVFIKTLEQSKNKILANVTPDVILMNDFLKAIKQMSFPKFLMMGRAWDLDVKEEIDFNNVNWEQKLRERISKEGKLEGFSASNYWVFPGDAQFNLPPFAVGQRGADNWLIYRARSLKMPVVDVTEVVSVVHQNHNFPQKTRLLYEVKKGENIRLAGGFSNMCTLRDADMVLTPQGLKKPKFPRRIFSELSLFYPWRLILGLKRRIQTII